MNIMRRCWLGASLAAMVLLTACSGASRPKPAEIATVEVRQAIEPVWSARVGEIQFPLTLGYAQGRVALADSQGQVALLDVATGRDVWRVALKEAIAAGVGTDGEQVALVTRNNQLVVLTQGREQWRAGLPAESFTAPLVAGGRVFVLSANRSVTAFDGATGRKLWSQQRTGEPLVLRQAGVLMPFKNTLLVGFAGRLAGLNPDTGVAAWEVAMATPRGTNDMERLVDLLGPAQRAGDLVCVRAFQSQVGCVNAERGQVAWTRPSVGERAIGGNEGLVLSTLSNGTVQAHRRSDGERLWESERLKYRQLSAPLVTPRGVLLADSGGWLYVLSTDDGSLLNRIRLDGQQGLAAPAVLAAASQVVLVSRDGRISGLRLP